MPPAPAPTPAPDPAAERRARLSADSARRTAPAIRYAAKRLLRVLTGLQGFDAFQTVAAISQFGRLTRALGIADPLAETMPFGPRWYRFQSIAIAAALDGEAQAVLGARRTYPQRALKLVESGTGLLRNAHFVARLDINVASEAELAALPGLGRRTVAKILAARARAPFATLDEARRAAELGSARWAATARFLMIAPAGAWTAPQLPDRPFAQLVQDAGAGRHTIPGLPLGSSLERTAIEVLSLCAGQIEQRALVPKFWAPSPRRMGWHLSAVSRAGPNPAGAAQVRQQVASVALLANGDYQRLLMERIDAASTSIRLSMFFFSAGAGLAGPGSQLVKALERAKQRGVDVKAILADTLPEDVRNAASINAPAMSALAAVGIAARSYWPETVLHEKSIVIDARHVLAGSHNWTAGSFFRYEDTSLYVDSAGLGVDLAERFDARWTALDPAERGRRCALRLLDILPRATMQSLAADNLRYADDLPTTRTALRALARNHGTQLELIELARDAGRLMCAFRIAETTAMILISGGLDTAAKVRGASRERLGTLFASPPHLPPPHDTRAIGAAIADILWEAR
jgi:hypothetical protein